MHSYSAGEPAAFGRVGWVEGLRRGNIVLFAALPAMLLFSRGAADAIVVAIGLSLLIAVAAKRNFDPLRSPIFLILAATWIILNAVISPLALDPEASFSRSIPWVRFVLFFTGVAYWAVQTRQDVKVITLAWCLTLLGVVIDGFIQLVMDISLSGQPIAGARLTGPLDRPNIGMFVARIGIAALAAWVWLITTRTHGRLLYAKSLLLIFSIVVVAFILLTGERTAALLSIVAIAAVVAVTVLVIPRFRLHGLASLAIAAVLVAAVLLTSGRMRERLSDTLATVGNLWASIYGELILAGWRVWEQYPLTGVGLKNFRLACEKLKSAAQISECHPHPHNIYIEWLAEGGLVGLLGFIGFVILLAWLVLRSLEAKGPPRLAGAFLVGGLVLTLSPISISQSFFSNWPAILMWTSLAAIGAIARMIIAHRSS